MQDFITFKTFISPTMLLLFYYIGAVVMPIFAWLACRWLMEKNTVLKEEHKVSKHIAKRSMNLKYRLIFIFLFIIIFLFMQIIWRMIFEFLIAYMQIRDVLVA